jgi:hypothetical protein
MSNELSLNVLEDRISTLKRSASFFINQRRRDVDLYALLAEALKVCEYVEEHNIHESLRDRVYSRSSKDKRSYVEKNSDVFVLVGRAIFEPEINRSASWRYSATLREASKLGLTSDDLIEWLKKNGGINALFKARPVNSLTAETRTLHLNDSITVPKYEEFTITLRRDSRGFFDVIRVG